MINEVYDEIERSGYKGLTYEQISKKFDSSANKSEKLQAYLSSHYCRKLLKLGLISQECYIDKKKRVWKRKMVASEYSQLDENNLLKKRSTIDNETPDKTLEPSWLRFYEGTSNYDPELSLDQNLLGLFLYDFYNDNEGFFTSEVTDRLMMQNRKKFVNRLLQNYIKKSIVVAKPYRDGKNLYKKLYINSELLGLSRDTKQSNFALRNLHNSQGKIQGDCTYNHLQASVIVPKEKKFDYSMIKTLDRDILTDLIKILKGNKSPVLFNVLLNNNKLGHIFDQLCSPSADTFISSLEPDQYNLICEKFINLSISKSQDLFGNMSFVDSVKRRSMLNTSLRLARTIQILNLVKANGYISVRDVINDIKANLEAGLEYVIDKKTILNICKDLEAIKIIRIKRFEVNYEEQTDDLDVILNRPDALIITKIFLIYHKYDVTDEELLRDRYVLKPYYNTEANAKESINAPVVELLTEVSDPKETITRFEKMITIFNIHSNILTRKALKALLLNCMIESAKKIVVDLYKETCDEYYFIDITNYMSPGIVDQRCDNESHADKALLQMTKEIIKEEKLVDKPYIRHNAIVYVIKRLFFYLRSYTRWSYSELRTKFKNSLAYHIAVYHLLYLNDIRVDKRDTDYIIQLRRS